MTDLITLTDPESESIERARGSAAAVVAAAHDLTVESPEQAERASEILRNLQTVRKRADAERLAITQPHRDHVAMVNDQYREPSAMLDKADGIVRVKLLDWQRGQERIRAARQSELDKIAAEQRARDEAERAALADEAREQREAWEAAEAKATDADTAEAAKRAADAMAQLERAREIAPLPVRTVETVAAPKPSAGVAVQRPWAFEVVNPDEIPRAFMVVDDKAIRQNMRDTVRADGEPYPIPGVRFYRDERLAVRGR